MRPTGGCVVCGRPVEGDPADPSLERDAGEGSVDGPARCPACGQGEARTRPRVRVQAPDLSNKKRRPASGPALGPPIAARPVGDAGTPFRATPAATAGTKGKLPLGGSIALGVATSIVVAAAWVYLTHLTGVIWVYSGLAFGVAIGIGFQYRSQPGTWRIRSYLAAACTAVGLFFAEYFLVRQLAVDQLREEGRFAHGGHVPIFLSPAQMVHVVGSTFHAYPSNYVIWPVTVYCAYAMPSASHKAARKRAAAAGR